MTNINMQLMLVGRVMTDGRLNARVKADLSDKLILKANAQVSASTGECVCSMVYLEYCIYHPFFFLFFQLTGEPHMSHAVFNFDYMVRNFFLFEIFLSVWFVLSFFISCLCREKTTEPNFNLGTVL